METPASKRLVPEDDLNKYENEKIKSPVIIPPAKENNETGVRNLNVVNVKNPERMAPNVAPEEIPRIPESARGFLKKPCKTAPVPPKRAPQIIQSIIRGSLNLKMMICSIPFFEKAEIN